ncbi:MULTISPECIES: hypothetical protein [unclassified Curtobacterium]|uniref:hypothetical protein n=1 Tax=unclassified Curtobacterium TaxID=257496 RepID=UPI00226BA874|nr:MULTISPECIES: hypothetical protein [unclassified Curtobacterium]
MTRTTTRLRTVLGVIAIALAATATAWVRLGPVARGTGWAEDTGLFFREHLALGPVGSLFHPYAGYLHLVPRLVVDAAFALPIDRYALAVSSLCCALAGVVCAAVFVLARDVVRPWPLRLVLAAVPVLLPSAPWEVTGNAANLHTFALVLSPWLFTLRPRTRWGAAAAAAAAVLVTCTEVQTVLFLPLLLVAWWPRDGDRRAARRALPMAVAALAGGAAQVVTALVTARASRPGDPGVADVAAGYLFSVVGGLGTSHLGSVGRAVVAHGWAVLVVPAVVLLAVLVVAALQGSWRTRVLLVALPVGSAVVWAAALVANASADERWTTATPAQLEAQTPSRYAAAAGLLLTMAVVVAAATLVDPERRAARPTSAPVPVTRSGGPARVVRAAVGWVVVAALVTTWVGAAGPGPTTRDGGPEWQPQVLRAAASCRAGDHPASVLVRSVPWAASVPCTLVLQADRSSGRH